MNLIHENDHTTVISLSDEDHSALHQTQTILRTKLNALGLPYAPNVAEAAKWTFLGMLREGKAPEQIITAARTMPLAANRRSDRKR